MNGTIMHMRTGTKHKPAHQRRSTDKINATDHESSPWMTRLISTNLNPEMIARHLPSTGESLRSQTCYALQRQNGNRFIQRECLSRIQRNDEYLLPNVSTSAKPVTPVPIPYPNTSNLANPSQTTSSVKTTNKTAVTHNSQVTQSKGDETGSMKGMQSSVNIGSTSFPSNVLFNLNNAAVTNSSGGNLSGINTLPHEINHLSNSEPLDPALDAQLADIGESVLSDTPDTTGQQSGTANELTILNELIAPGLTSQVSRAVDPNTQIGDIAPAVGAQGGALSDHLARRINRSLGNGAPLAHSKRMQMEPKFGTPFANVRLHTDSEADNLSQRLSARAFTIGNDIYFNHRANPQDDRLLTHELSHVVQQRHMSSNGPMTVGPANDHLEQQAKNYANNSSVNAYTYSFSEQRKQAVQRDFMDEFSLGNVAGVTGMGADISTGLHQLKNVALAQKLGMTAPQLSNLTQAPIVGTLSKIAAPIGLITGSMDMMNEKKPWYERLVGGMSALGGATGTASTIAGWLGSGLFSAGGAAGMSAGAGTALTGGGAGLLSGAGAATALGSLGAVAGAGAGGYALGRLMDEGFGGIANLIAGDKKKDRTLSGYGARGLGWLDKKISGLWRDPSKPAYTQSIGWKLSEWLGI